MCTLLKAVIFLLMVKVAFLQTLKLRALNSFTNVNILFRPVHLLFQPNEPLCVFSVLSLEDHDVLDIISKELSMKNKLITVETSFKKMLKRCKNILIWDVSSSSVCDLFTQHKTKYLSLKHNIILGYLRLNVDIRTLTSCSSSFDLALVRVLLLLSARVFVLNSSFATAKNLEQDGLTVASVEQFTSLRGKHVRVATFHFPPFSIIKEYNNVVEYDGMEMKLFHLVSEYLHFSWGLVELKGPSPWGKLLPNKTVVGGLEQAIREDADVAFCNYWQRLEFLDTMDFGPPLNELYLTFLVRRPQQQHSRWQILIATFSTQVWILAILAFVSVTFTHWLGRSVHIYPAKASVSESALIIFGMLTSSSSHACPPRGLLLWWSFFGLLFTTSLTGSVVTRLAVPLFSPRLDTYRQAVEGGYYWVSPGFYNRSSYLASYMFNMKNYWQRRFVATYRNKEIHELNELVKSDPSVMFPAQRWGNDFVIFNNVFGLDGFVDMSDFRVMSETSREVFTSFVFKKESPLNELLSVATQSLIDRGLWDYLRRTHSSKGELKQSKQLMVERDLSVLSQPEPFTLLKLYPVFVLLVIGNCLAFFVFLVELCCYKRTCL